MKGPTVGIQLFLFFVQVSKVFSLDSYLLKNFIQPKDLSVQLEDTTVTAGAYTGVGSPATGYFSSSYFDSSCSQTRGSTAYPIAESCSPLSSSTSYKLICNDEGQFIQQIYSSLSCDSGSETYWALTTTSTCTAEAYGYYYDQAKCISAPLAEVDSFLQSSGYSILTKMFNNTASVPASACTSNALVALTAEYNHNHCFIDESMTSSSSTHSYTTSCNTNTDSILTKLYEDMTCKSIAAVAYSPLTSCSASSPISQSQTCLLSSTSTDDLAFSTSITYKYPLGTDKKEYGSGVIYEDSTCSTVTSYFTAALNKCVYIEGVYGFWTYKKGSKPSGAIYSDSKCTNKLASISSYTWNTCQEMGGVYFKLAYIAPGKLTTPAGSLMAAVVSTDSSGAVSFLMYRSLNTPYSEMDSEDGTTSYTKYTCKQGRVIITSYTDSSFSTKTFSGVFSIMSGFKTACVSPKTLYLTSKPNNSPIKKPTSSNVHKPTTITSKDTLVQRNTHVKVTNSKTKDVYTVKKTNGVSNKFEKITWMHAKVTQILKKYRLSNSE